MKKLTIAIPTYNRKDYILNKVENISKFVQENTLENNIELLVVDNSSTNYDIYELLKNYKKLGFVKIQRNCANIGAGANFLKCIEFSNSEYVWLLGDDEILNIVLLNQLLNELKKKDCYMIPHNDSYAKHSNYFGTFSSVDELFDNFWNLGSFFVLSIFIFKKESALCYLKNGYESVVYQHPYCAIVLSMLSDGKNIELINVPLLKVQNSACCNPRFDMINACIDIVNTVKPYCTNKQFEKYLKSDFYPGREKIVFTLNLGISRKIDTVTLISNYKRLISLFPFFSKMHFKSLMWIFIVNLRRSNITISILLFLISKIKSNKFSKMSLNDIYIYISSNLQENKTLRH